MAASCDCTSSTAAAISDSDSPRTRRVESQASLVAHRRSYRFVWKSVSAWLIRRQAVAERSSSWRHCPVSLNCLRPGPSLSRWLRGRFRVAGCLSTLRCQGPPSRAKGSGRNPVRPTLAGCHPAGVSAVDPHWTIARESRSPGSSYSYQKFKRLKVSFKRLNYLWWF